MPIRKNSYFNDPGLAQIGANLADLFAAPSGADAAGWAAARAKDMEAERDADRYRGIIDPNATPDQVDRFLRTMPGGVKNTYYSDDQSNATQRYGFDRAYQSSTENNAADNVRALEDRRMQEAGELQRFYATPVKAAAGETVFIPNQTQDATGFAPILHGSQSLDELQAAVFRGLTPGQQQAKVMHDVPIEQIVGPTGTPQFVTRNDAIGQQPYTAPATSGLVNYQTQDGKSGTAIYDPSVGYKDTQTGIPLPQGVRTFTAQLSGGAKETGLAKTTEAEDKNAYAATMAEGATNQILTAFDEGKLPNATDFQALQAMRLLPMAMQPAIVSQMSPEGQIFYQNVRTALPYQLMSQSGQAVTEQEYERKMLELIPVPGESKEVTTAKRRQFETYIKAAKGVSGDAYSKIHERGNIKEPPSSQEPLTPPAPSGSRLRFNPETGELE